ncbi:hypothetical protein SAMN05216266_12189 [Amycolatopsis marina]|uniref:Uncharacterized protein n=1 Tax=Amycolatopsis marina TaxID=490629 RepID=A0A1I1C5K4_9PSEU|nr:hypothetical protein [Amycolatopsis marina]SFB57945.1 hypothetical protein SAMN05216266_12189 [Amycolatopsis marina]
MCCPSATLSVWSSAWLNGAAAADNALDALAAWGEAHEVVAADAETADRLDLPVAGAVPVQPAQLLGALRGIGAADARLALPVPGDVRGLGGGGPFTEGALHAGEAALFPSAGCAVVPQPIAEGLLRWTVYPVPVGTAPEFVGIGEAEHLLTDAVRVSAGTLQQLDVARDRPGVRGELKARLRSAPKPGWPAPMPGRCLLVLQRADEVEAILALALSDEPGGALSASATAQRSEALRPLSDAVRTARCAAVTEAVRVLSGDADRQV